MADNISDVLAPEVIPDLREFVGLLKDATAEVKNMAAATKGITIELKNVKDYAGLVELTKKHEEAIKQLSVVEVEYSRHVKESIALKEAQNGKTEKIIAGAKSLAEIEKTEAQSRRENAKAMLDEERAAKLLRTEKEREEKAVGKLNNEYTQLRAQYKAASDEAKRLGVVAENLSATLGKQSAAYKVAAGNAESASKFSMGLYDSLLRVEKSVGQAQRQVGQYNTAAFAMSQILRETPSFAYSAATGFLAMSNNIPILIDEINKLRTANAVLKAEGAATIPIWKTLASSLFSFNGLVTLGIAAITIYTARMGMHKSAMSDAEKVSKKYNDTLQQIEETQTKNAVTEQARISSLLGIAKNTQIAMDIRLRVIRSLQEEYPDYLGNIDKEKFLTGQLTGEVEKLNSALVQRGLMQATTEKIGAAYTKIIDSEREILKIDKERFQWTAKQLKLDPQARFGQASFQPFETRQAPFRKAIQDAKKEIEEMQQLADKYASGAGALAFDDAKDPKKKKEKKVADITLKSEQDLTKALADQQKTQVEIYRDSQKTISEDVKAKLADRLVAYQEFSGAQIKLAQIERDKEIALQDEKIKEINRLKVGKNGATLSNLIDQEHAAIVRRGTAAVEYQKIIQDIEADGKKKILNIVHSANDEWVKDESFRNEKLKELQISLYLVEEQLLLRAFENKEMTRKEYDKRLKDLQRKQNIAFLQNEVEYAEKILSNDQLTAEKRLEFEKKLNSSKEQLFKAQKGKGTTRKTGRVTDSLAMLFAPEDLDNQEQYLQEFYDRTVQLANQAADAIIAAKRRAFDAEKEGLQREEESAKNAYQMRLDFINSTVRSEVDRANQISQLQAQYAAQQAAIDAKKRQVAQKQAAAEKTAAIAAIIQSTAVAIAGALKYGPAAPPIIALIAAAGAVQLAAASSAPVPAYKMGTMNHPGGPFVAGDGGKSELIVAPGKAPYWSKSVSTLYSEAPGTKVLPPEMLGYAHTVGGGAHLMEMQLFASSVVGELKMLGQRNDRIGQNIYEALYATAQKPVDMRPIAEQMRRQNNLQ